MSKKAHHLPEENFEDLLEESFGQKKSFEGQVVKGRVLANNGDILLVDVGLKSEGRIPLKEFGAKGKNLNIGDHVEVFVERMEDRHGEIVLSYEKARREAAWEELEVAHKGGDRVLGTICGRVKGGFTVDLAGAIAFLPGSQLDIRPIKDLDALVGLEQPFQILKMDRPRGNIVVSRRAVLEESRTEARNELMGNLQEGSKLKGIVKNITDYGAFIDLGGIDGLLHVTDISWQRINHPSEVLEVGQSVDVVVIKFNPENQRISLGMKQLASDPWQGVGERFTPGEVRKGTVTNVADYGVFVELEPGVEGLIHVSELSWTKKSIQPTQILSPSEEVTVKVLDVDGQKRRISLSLRQCTENPFDAFLNTHPVGSTLEATVKVVREHSLIVTIEDGLEGRVSGADISWEKMGEEAVKDYKEGQVITVKVIGVDFEHDVLRLGIKQLSDDPFEKGLGTIVANEIVTCVITNILDNGIEVKVGESGLVGFIRKSDLSRERGEQRPDRFAVGEKVDAMVTSIDQKARRFSLSIKARELKEERDVMAEYGSSDSGASLGDILGAAIDMNKIKGSKTEKEPAAKKAQKEEAADEAEAPQKKKRATKAKEE